MDFFLAYQCSKRGELTRRGELSYEGGTGVFFLSIYLMLYLDFKKNLPAAGFSILLHFPNICVHSLVSQTIKGMHEGAIWSYMS